MPIFDSRGDEPGPGLRGFTLLKPVSVAKKLVSALMHPVGGQPGHRVSREPKVRVTLPLQLRSCGPGTRDEAPGRDGGSRRGDGERGLFCLFCLRSISLLLTVLGGGGASLARSGANLGVGIRWMDLVAEQPGLPSKQPVDWVCAALRRGHHYYCILSKSLQFSQCSEGCA